MMPTLAGLDSGVDADKEDIEIVVDDVGDVFQMCVCRWCCVSWVSALCSTTL
jgi:hypothetical protein